MLINFLLLGLVLFGLVRLLKRMGLGNFKAQGSQECPYCKEFVAIDATTCKWCTADIDPDVAGEETPQIATERWVAE